MECVAPYAGAWIEMPPLPVRSGTLPVAPYAGAWIEILVIKPQREKGKRSLPTRERGLKLLKELLVDKAGASLPTRERGLKFLHPRDSCIPPESLPTRERGLKFLYPTLIPAPASVAPYAGAWIEICDYVSSTQRHLCRSLRGSVD